MPKQTPPSNDKSLTAIHPLLVSRRNAATMLGYSDVSTMRRLEAQGLLTPRRVNKTSPTGQVMYAYDDIVRLAQGDA